MEEFVKVQGYRETLKLGEKLKEYLSERWDWLKPETKAYLERMLGNWEDVV